MTRLLTSMILLIIFSFVHGQSLNTTFLGSYDDNSLLIQSGIQYNDIWGYASGGKEFAIIGTREKILFLDVTNPANITPISYITPGGNSTWRDMKTFGTYAYAVADRGSEGLLTFDLSDIDKSTNPTVTQVNQQNALFTRAHNVFIDTDNGILYVLGANVANADIIIYELNTNPANPTHVKTVDLPGNYIHDAYVKNHIAYCSHGGNGLFVYDMSNITIPADGSGAFTELGRIDIYNHQGYNHSSWASGDYIVFADETHGKPLKMVDASDWEDMQIIDFFQSNQLGVPNPTTSVGSIPHNPFIIGNLCIVSYYHDGVVFYDISDPNNVSEVGYYDTETSNTTYSNYAGCWGVYPFLPSGRIIASDVLNGLQVLEISSSLSALTILPVTWKSISAQVVNKQVKLDWSTGEELNNKGFWVQKQNNKGKFEDLGFILPNTNKTYTYWDESPYVGQNIYRIAQEDYDGTISYSSLASATIKGDETKWMLFPNPIFEGTSIVLETEKASPFRGDLFDIHGRLIQQYSILSPSTKHTLVLPNLIPGCYLLKGDESEWMKVMIK